MEQEEKTASKRRKTLERELEWVRMAPKARQAKGKARLNSYDKLLNEDVEGEGGKARNLHPQRSPSGQQGHRSQARGKGVWRQAPVRRSQLHAAA